MSRRYFAGKAQPGSETRADELKNTGLGWRLREKLCPGTFNVALMETPSIGEPDLIVGPYRLWECRVATLGMVERNELGIPGWVIRAEDEHLPGHFVEVISPHCIRKALKMENWPAFPVEIELECNDNN